MNRILITGATGNVGAEVIHYLLTLYPDLEIIAAVRDIDKAKRKFRDYPNLLFRQFDFEEQHLFDGAFLGIDTLFLLRPPHLSSVKKVFRPLLESAREHGIRRCVFVSVQGVEQSRVIPPQIPKGT